MGVSCVHRSSCKTGIPRSAATVVWLRTMRGGLGQVLGTSRLLTTHGVTIADSVHDIVPGLSFPVIVNSFGMREVVLRQRANVGYVMLLTTGVVQVPHEASHGTSPVPEFTTLTTTEGVVGVVSGTPGDPDPGRSPGPAAPAGGGPATPARPRYQGQEGTLL